MERFIDKEHEKYFRFEEVIKEYTEKMGL